MFLVKYKPTFIYANGRVETSDRTKTKEFDTIEQATEFRERKESYNQQNLSALEHDTENKVEIVYSNIEIEVK